jgi:MoxR-like ATPase
VSTIVPQEKVALEAPDDIALADRLRRGRDQIITELRKLIVGQEDVIEQAMLSLLSGGNCLIIGVPGLAKTLLIHTFAQVLDLKFSRIQFTPDLMPSEINRTPPKTQAALLEAMQEHRVTVQGRTYTLAEPFFVFATQNPIELEGTYPLPEAQLDRFMFQVNIGYLSEDDELEVVRSTTAIQSHQFQHAITGADIVAFQRLVRRVPIAEAVARYAVHLVRASRPTASNAPDFIKKWVSYGASTRAAQYLVLGGKARALMHGRYHVGFDDIKALAHPVLRHRILTNFHAQSERVTTDQLIDQLLAAVPLPKSRM